MKMIHTSYGYMTPTEAKTIGDIARDEKKQKKKQKKKHLNKAKPIKK